MATSDLVVNLRLSTEPMERTLRQIAQNFIDCADALAVARTDEEEDKG